MTRPQETEIRDAAAAQRIPRIPEKALHLDFPGNLLSKRSYARVSRVQLPRSYNVLIAPIASSEK
jgi:hypothetical protein